MGTETHQHRNQSRTLARCHVKLNNPQMGTETDIDKNSFMSFTPFVKLNNPQMGTETGLLPCYQIFFCNSFLLN